MAKLGQHFLIRKDVPQKIVAALELGKGDFVIEIGPGHGELTLSLLWGLDKLGGKLVAIEKDAGLAKDLMDKLSGHKNFSVKIGDALKILPALVDANVRTSDVRTLRLPKYKLVGNLPYYISGYFFRTISELKNKPRKTVVMIQREVGERLSAKPPRMNRLAASVQFWGEPEIIMNLGSKDFRPAPKVDSVVVVLTTHNKKFSVEEDAYYETVRKIFRQPRKNILNNLFERGKSLSKAEWAERLTGINLDPEIRPQNLGIEQICAIAKLANRDPVTGA